MFVFVLILLGMLAPCETCQIPYKQVLLFGNTYCTNIATLDLSRKEITGVLPSEIQHFSKLTYLDISHNKLKGTIPKEISSLTRIKYLFFQYNQFNNEIPDISELQQLIEVNLRGNELKGTIPSTLGRLQQLALLNLRSNRLNGTVPTEIGKLGSLTHLDIGNNDLHGEIPSQMGSMKKLEFLRLQNNKLTGEIPSELGLIQNLKYLDLHGNNLEGILPIELSNLSTLAFVDVDENNLSICPTDEALILSGTTVRNSKASTSQIPILSPVPSLVNSLISGPTTSCIQEQSDIIFVLDESGSIGRTRYENLVESISGFVSKVPIPAKYRVGLVEFSGKDNWLWKNQTLLRCDSYFGEDPCAYYNLGRGIDFEMPQEGYYYPRTNLTDHAINDVFNLNDYISNSTLATAFKTLEYTADLHSDPNDSDYCLNRRFSCITCAMVFLRKVYFQTAGNNIPTRKRYIVFIGDGVPTRGDPLSPEDDLLRLRRDVDFEMIFLALVGNRTEGNGTIPSVFGKGFDPSVYGDRFYSFDGYNNLDSVFETYLEFC